MRSTTSKPTTKPIRVKHSFLNVPAAEKARLAKNLTELRQRLKEYGAVPVSPEMKRRLVAAGAWGMPDE